MANLKVWNNTSQQWEYVSRIVKESTLSVYTWVVENPSVEGISGCRVPENVTAVRINSFVTTSTSATFNIEVRSTIGTAGNNLLASDQVATTSGAESTSLQNPSVLAGNWLWLDISAISGTPEKLIVSLTMSD